MTIASTNVSVSAIIAEKNATGARSGSAMSSTNVSFKELSGKEVKQQNVAGTGAGSTYALAKETWAYGRDTTKTSGTVVAAQGTGSAGLNSSTYSFSEWVGYDPMQSKIGNASTPVVQHPTDDTGANCIAVARAEIQIWCTKSGSTISIYGQRGSIGTTNGHARKIDSSGTLTNLTAATVLGTITENTSGMLPTGCTMSYDTITNSGTGTCFGSGGSVSTVANGTNSTTNLGATKVGYKVGVASNCEGANNASGLSTMTIGARFNWTWPTSPSGDAYEPSYTEVVVTASGGVTHSYGGFGC
jgi:hypothetical protein